MNSRELKVIHGPEVLGSCIVSTTSPSWAKTKLITTLDGYNNLLELAKGENYTKVERNSASLSYFALKVYAFDVAIPREGCVGKAVERENDGHFELSHE